MKKFFIFAAAACVALAGCTKTEPIQVDNSTRVGFSPLTHKTATKATWYGEQNATYTGDGSTYEAFKAFAAFTEDDTTVPAEDFFPAAGIECTKNATEDYWEPTTAYYWPKDGYLTFRAVSPNDFSPYAGTVANTWASGISITGFTASTTINQQVDILYSDAEAYKQRSAYDPETGIPYDDKTGDKASHNGVDIVFRHALSSVNFKVKTDDDYTAGTQQHKFTVKKIEVNNVFTEGEFYENRNFAAATPNAYANIAATDYISFNGGNENTASPYWTAADTEAKYTPYDDGTGQEVTATATAIGTMMLPMPQTLDHTLATLTNATANTVEVTVTYDYEFKNGASTHTSTNLTTTFTLANRAGTYNGGAAGTYPVNQWLINHKYTYVLNFKLDKIIFDPKVELFVEVTDINVDLPYQN